MFTPNFFKDDRLVGHQVALLGEGAVDIVHAVVAEEGEAEGRFLQPGADDERLRHAGEAASWSLAAYRSRGATPR